MKLEEEFLAEITQAIAAETIVLPTLPEVALRVREAVDDPNVTVNTLTELISKDPVLSAKIVKVANSPLLRGSIRVDSLSQAINRLGLKFVRNLATGLAMEHIFQATNHYVDKFLREVWQHSLEVAAISGIIAKNFTSLPADEATLAGLTHEIGILPILAMSEDKTEIIGDEDLLLRIIDKIHPELGNNILTSWDFPEEIACIPLNIRNFTESHSNSITISDIVAVAKINSKSLPENDKLKKIDPATCPSFKKLGMDPAINIYEMEQLKQELSAATQCFV